LATVLVDQLRKLFEDSPVEAGVSHPAEAAIQTAATRFFSELGDWIANRCPAWDPGFAASVLECMGRVDTPECRQIALQMTRYGLRSPHVVVRDAAIRTLEQLGGNDARELLRAHSEPVGWLAVYAKQVVEEMP
jgi:hypothetical protein